jgi:hypothetical protein
MQLPHTGRPGNPVAARRDPVAARRNPVAR